MKRIEVEGLRGNIVYNQQVADSVKVEVLCDLGYEDDVALMIYGVEPFWVEGAEIVAVSMT